MLAWKGLKGRNISAIVLLGNAILHSAVPRACSLIIDHFFRDPGKWRVAGGWDLNFKSLYEHREVSELGFGLPARLVNLPLINCLSSYLKTEID